MRGGLQLGLIMCQIGNIEPTLVIKNARNIHVERVAGWCIRLHPMCSHMHHKLYDAITCIWPANRPTTTFAATQTPPTNRLLHYESSFIQARINARIRRHPDSFDRHQPLRATWCIGSPRCLRFVNLALSNTDIDQWSLDPSTLNRFQ